VKRALDHLLETVSSGDWNKYEQLCDKKITVCAVSAASVHFNQKLGRVQLFMSYGTETRANRRQ